MEKELSIEQKVMNVKLWQNHYEPSEAREMSNISVDELLVSGIKAFPGAKHLSQFNAGDVITVIEPSDSESGEVYMSNLVGRKVEFRGMANNMFYIRVPYEEIPIAIDSPCADGWELYEDPK